MKTILVLLMLCSICKADGLTEVNYWRKHNRLPLFKEDKELTKFAQEKANFRAINKLQNGHQGPKTPDGCVEGTGESTPDWGWLTCLQESEGEYAGAGVAISGKLRYMVLVVRGRGRPLINPNNIKTVPTAHLTPNPPTFP